MRDDRRDTISQNRCRLVLIADAAVFNASGSHQVVGFAEALQGGDIASILFHAGDLDETAFQDTIEPLIDAAQRAGVACVVHEYSRVAGRVGADGLQLGQDAAALEAAISKHHSAMMVGAGNVKTRHNALMLGEMQPDFVMFGRPGGDTRPQPNPKNLDLGTWWSSMIEIPCIVLGGTNVESVVTVAKTGAEFVALGEAVFTPHNGTIDFEAASAAIVKANRLLDEHAPRFEQED